MSLSTPFFDFGVLICTEASILLSSKSFDPKAFLTAVHPNATFQDLADAVNHLRSALDSRSEAIRVLVEDNFDRFVAVKSNTDGKSCLGTPATQLYFLVSIVRGDEVGAARRAERIRI